MTKQQYSLEFPTVHTLIVDSKKRLRLPDAESNQVEMKDQFDVWRFDFPEKEEHPVEGTHSRQIEDQSLLTQSGKG